MIWILVLIYCGICAALCGVVAGAKNRDSFTWLWVGFLTGIFGLIAIAGMPAKSGGAGQYDSGERVTGKQVTRFNQVTGSKTNNESGKPVSVMLGRKFCPYCGVRLEIDDDEQRSFVCPKCGKTVVGSSHRESAASPTVTEHEQE